MESIGPGSSTKFILNLALSENLLAHTKYIANLRLWDQFLIWRYTLGSGAINFSLIGIAKNEQKIYWTYNFFRSYKYDVRYIDRRFSRYINFFRDPRSYINNKDNNLIAEDIILNVIDQLQRIIALSPKIIGSFTVWKVSSSYPELSNLEQKDGIVHQSPFNSTSYDPQFNFGIFLAPDATCCLHKITIPEGSSVLLISSNYHAYPFELECLLPWGSDFIVSKVSEEGFYYIPKEQQKLIPVQDMDNLRIGTVFMIDPTSDKYIVEKKLKYYVSELRT